MANSQASGLSSSYFPHILVFTTLFEFERFLKPNANIKTVSLSEKECNQGILVLSRFTVTRSLKRLCKQPLLVIVKGNLPELTPILTLTLNAKYNLSFENSLQFSKKGVLTKIE